METNRNKIGVFPGSFDPFTKGHEAIIHKAIPLFDEIVIAIGVNQSKNYLFSLEKRIAHIESLFTESKVKVLTYSGLTIDFCKQINASYLIRGLRDSKDFGYERSIAHMNFQLHPIETVFFLTNVEYAAINATIVREIFKSGGPIDQFVTHAELLK